MRTSGHGASLLAACLVTGLAAPALAQSVLTVGPTFGVRLRDGAPEYGLELAFWGPDAAGANDGRAPFVGADVGITNRHLYSELQLMLPPTSIVNLGLSPGLAFDFDRKTAEVITTAWASFFFGLVPYVRVGIDLGPLDLSAGVMLKVAIPLGHHRWAFG